MRANSEKCRVDVETGAATQQLLEPASTTGVGVSAETETEHGLDGVCGLARRPEQLGLTYLPADLISVDEDDDNLEDRI